MRQRKHPLFDIPLPSSMDGSEGTTDQAIPPVDGGVQIDASPTVPMEVVEIEPAVACHAQKSHRTETTFSTTQQDQMTFTFQKGPAMFSSKPHRPETPAPATVLASVLPVHDEAPAAATGSGGLPNDPPISLSSFTRWVPALIFVGVGAVVLLVSLMIIERPLSQLTQGVALDRQKEFLEAQQRSEYRALDAEVQSAIRRIDRNLSQVALHTRRQISEAETGLKQGLPQIRAFPRQRPRELDLAILQSNETAAQWSGFLDAASGSAELDETRAALSALRTRAAEGRLIPADRELAATLLDQSAQQEDMSNKRAVQVRRLSESLGAQRFKESLTQFERR